MFGTQWCLHADGGVQNAWVKAIGLWSWYIGSGCRVQPAESSAFETCSCLSPGVIMVHGLRLSDIPLVRDSLIKHQAGRLRGMQTLLGQGFRLQGCEQGQLILSFRRHLHPKGQSQCLRGSPG
ncbi:hypothetical protein ABBQ32_007166 [Trebouxia sp. C0010 RCD-2024]